MAKKLDRAEMRAALECVFEPAGKGLTSEQINEQLLLFCANCPDPVSAMDLVLEAPVDSTTEQVLDEALAMPPRSLATWSEAEVAKDHPLRRMVFER
jgi:hypothetical protein